MAKNAPNGDAPVNGYPCLLVPQDGISLAATTEARAMHVRKGVNLLAEGFDETRLPESFNSMFVPRWEPDHGIRKHSNNLRVRAAWNLVCTWLVARGSGALNRSAGLGEGEDWFWIGSNVQMPRLSSFISSDCMVQAYQELSKVEIDEDFWELFPYILEEHGPGSRASVIRDPSTKPARNAKKLNGVFYTPADVADYMAKHMLTNYAGDISRAKCLDPACGTGVFLLSVARAVEEHHSVTRTGPFDRFMYAVNNLFGCDISHHAIDACAFVLLHHCHKDVVRHTLSPWSAWRAIRLNLAATDSLMLAPGKNNSISNKGFSIRERQKQALFDLPASLPAPDKEVGRNNYASGQSLFPDQRIIRIGELFAAAASGFDLLIGNPPYSCLGKRTDYDLLNSEYHSFRHSHAGPGANIFLPFVEMMWRLTVRSRNSTALVTPLSIAYNSGPQYEGCRKAMMRQGGRWQFAFFDREPHALFGEDVKTRNAILFHTENETVPQRGKASDIETGPLRKWTSRTRNKLFESISFTNIGTPDIAAGILKIEGPLQAAVIASLNSSRHRLQSFCVEIGKRKVADAFNSNNQNHVFIGGTAYNFLNIFRSFSIEADSEFPLSESPVHCLEFSSESDAFVAYAILNSRIVFWLWHIQADGFHVSSRLIKNIPFDRDSLTDEQLIRLAKSGKALWEKVQVRRFSSINGGKLTYTFCPLSCNEEKDEIDSILVEASGLPTEFVLELKNFIRKIVVVDETDDKRRHLRQYFVGGVDLCAAN